MFDPAAFTIAVQAAGGSGDWRIWHYVVVDDTPLEEVTSEGFFSPMAPHITPGSVVYVVAPGYVAQLALVKQGPTVTGKVMCSVEIPPAVEEPHLQLTPNQPGGGNHEVDADPEHAET